MSGPLTIRCIRFDRDIAYVPLTQGYEAIVDAADAHLVSGRNWQALVVPHTIYAVSRPFLSDGFRAPIYMHRLIMSAPPDMEVDHRSMVGTDNRRANLRIATRSQNASNKPIQKNNTSGLKGVSWHRDSSKWRATITINRRAIHLGTFHSKEAAHAAYRDASARLHGEFGRPE